MFWHLLHFYPPFGEEGLLLLMFLIAMPVCFVGRLLKRVVIVKKILTVVFVVGVFVMDILYYYGIATYLGAFSNLILIPVAAGFVVSWIEFPARKRKM